MDKLPFEVIEIIIMSLSLTDILNVCSTDHLYMIIGKRVLFNRHWTSAQEYSQALRICMSVKSKYAYKFMIRHAISNETIQHPTYIHTEPSHVIQYASTRCVARRRNGRRCRRKLTTNNTTSLCYQHVDYIILS